MVEVEQRDRDAAADFYERYLARPDEVPVAAAMRMRHIDDSPLVQAFAKHRTDAIAREGEQPTTAQARVEAGCSCMEVYGEDPKCISHGRGTAWAKANPDLVELYDRSNTMRAALEPFADFARYLAAETTGFDDSDELPLVTEDGHVLMRFSVGSFRTALAALPLSAPDHG